MIFVREASAAVVLVTLTLLLQCAGMAALISFATPSLAPADLRLLPIRSALLMERSTMRDAMKILLLDENGTACGEEVTVGIESSFRKISGCSRAGIAGRINRIRAGVVQWQYRSFPSFGRGFDSHRPLQVC